MYRPKDWKNPYNGYRVYTGEGAVNQANENLRAQSELAYEAGADAILEALRKQGCPTIDKLGEGPYTLGVSFFIPDDEDSR